MFSPTFLADFLSCRHKTSLEMDARAGKRPRPSYADPLADILRKRGEEHEHRYVESLRVTGLTVVDLSPFKDPRAPEAGIARTLTEMHRGVDVVVQAPLGNSHWFGYADVLVKVPGPSGLGEWHYEAHDTKLARETRAGSLLQLCVYTQLLGEIQGFVPTFFHVVTPAGTQSFRYTDVAAYYRLVQMQLMSHASSPAPTYPDPCEHCGICRWWEVCNAQRRDDDHLQFVAGLGRGHKRELEALGITTKQALAEWTVPSPFNPTRGSRGAFVRIQDQAALQVKQEKDKTPQYKILPLEPHVAADGTPLPLRGLKRLPPPSPGDLYLDLEGDPFARSALGGEVGEGSREYLFGLGSVDETGEFRFRSWWAFTDADERKAFEEVMDEIARVVAARPDAHVYHYAPYEPSAFKRLAGRYATRAEDLDIMLRAGRLVDLYSVVRESIRAGVESYSIKELEQFYAFARDIDLRTAGRERQAIETALESGDLAAISEDVREAVERYNRDDVRSTHFLHIWLEARRDEAIDAGAQISRPDPAAGTPSEKVKERDQRVLDLRAVLMDETEYPGASTPGAPRYLMAYLLDFHRREDKSEWWDFYRLADLEDIELLEERKALAGLEFVNCLGPVISDKTGKPGKLVIDRYRFPQQECDIRVGEDLFLSDKKTWAEVAAIDRDGGTIDVQSRLKRAGLRPASCFAHKYIPPTSIEDALFSIGGALASGTAAPLAVALLRADPPLTRNVLELAESVLAIQGPPGTGKTYRGGEMICDLVAAGKRVGVTAHGHAAIANLLKAVRLEAAKRGNSVPILHVKNEAEFGDDDPKVVGGTAWHWTSDDAEPVDVLFVDEAGQMSLANTLACTVSATALVLLGDPQQLEQPTKGVHPDGVGGSALGHFLAGHKTMPPERGEFIDMTRRLAPPIAAFTSECFYESRLTGLDGLERQVLRGTSRFSGAGLRVVPVEHDGNRNTSDEEVDEVVRVVADLLAPGSEWVNKEGQAQQLRHDHLRIVAPYNAQVNRIQEALARAGRSGIPVGTVDKFQGQEAPVVIYSMATSRPEDAPRGLGFLYSLNRLNVATSRARCLCILVASPRLFEPNCQSPYQMLLANALCRYREMAV